MNANLVMVDTKSFVHRVFSKADRTIFRAEFSRLLDDVELESIRKDPVSFISGLTSISGEEKKSAA